jgi:phosphate transport system protein
MEEMRRTFHHDIEVVREQLARLTSSVIEEIPRATAVLLDGDLEGAEFVIRADDEIDARAIEIEERVYQLIALQAPVASDLRQLVAILKIVADVERSADLCVNICKASRRIFGHELDPKLRGIIAKMSHEAQRLYEAALESFEDHDAAKAAAIDDMDTALDGLQRDMIKAIIESNEHGRTDLEVAVQLTLVARFYERLGDHAVNMGERVRYVVTGWVHEQRGAARFRATMDDADDTDGIPRMSPPSAEK